MSVEVYYIDDSGETRFIRDELKYDRDPTAAEFSALYRHVGTLEDVDSLEMAYKRCQRAFRQVADILVAKGERSMMVGDVLVLDGEAYKVADAGFERVEGLEVEV